MPVAGTVSSSVPWLFTPSDTPFYIALNADLNGIAAVLLPTPTRAGDILYATGSTASTWTTLAGNNSGTKFLQETSVGVPSWAAVAASGSLVIINTYASTQTITIPATATKGFVRMWGGSGGSGGVDTTVNGSSGSTGAGGYLEKYLTGLTPGNTLAWTQGAAGAAGSNAPGAGGNGGNSTLASGTQTISTLTANGSNGTAASTAGASGVGTAGGTATGGDFNAPPASAVNSGVSRAVAAAGMNLFSPGALGVISSGSALAGNAGNPGGLVVFWFT